MLVGAVLGGGVLVAACSHGWDPVTADPELPPSILEMDVSSPDAVLDHTIDAWQDGDFELLSQLLTSDARGRIMLNLDMDGISTDPTQVGFELRDVNQASHEHIREMFDGAAVSGTLPIDLTGGITNRSADITIDTATISGALADGSVVVATLWRQPNNEWRLHQVRTHDADPDVVPFSAPPGAEPPPRDRASLSSTDTLLPTTDPAALAEVSLRLVEAGDFPRLVFLFNREVFVQLTGGGAVEAFTTPAGHEILADLTLQHEWGGLWSAIWTEAVALDAMWIDPEGPYTIGEVRDDPGTVVPFAAGGTVVVDVTDNTGTRYEVRLVDVGAGVYQLLQIKGPGGADDRYPFS